MVIAMGKEQLRLMKYALRYPDGWHYCSPGKVRRAARRLEGKGIFEFNAKGEFRINITREEKS